MTLRGCGQMHALLKAPDARRPASDNGVVPKAAWHVHQGAVSGDGSTASGTSPILSPP